MDKNVNNKINDNLSIVETLKVIIIATVVYRLIFNFLLINAVIPSGSMQNTLGIGDRVIADRFIFRFTGIERGDIVIFHPTQGDKQYLIKRVIGMPGDTIEGIDGYVYINGVKIDESYVKDLLSEDFGPYIVPNDCYFMLGDNRTNSYDSRSWNNKYVSSNKIVGKAILKYNGSFYIFKTPSYNIK